MIADSVSFCSCGITEWYFCPCARILLLREFLSTKRKYSYLHKVVLNSIIVTSLCMSRRSPRGRTHLVPDGAHEPSKTQGPQQSIGGFSQPTAASADQRRLQPAASASKVHGKHQRRLQPTNGGFSQRLHPSKHKGYTIGGFSQPFQKHNENKVGGFSPPFQNTMKTKSAASAR